MIMTYLKNVSTLRLDTDKCTGCKMCIKVCPHEVFRFENKKAVIHQLDHCMECSACALNCEEGALSVTKGVGCAAAVIGTIFSLGNNDTCC